MGDLGKKRCGIVTFTKRGLDVSSPTKGQLPEMDDVPSPLIDRSFERRVEHLEGANDRLCEDEG